MVDLNLDVVNIHSPYKVTKAKANNGFSFVTDFGVGYSVYFLEDDIIQSDESYEFVIANTNNKKSPRDRKIRETITSIVYEFFDENNSTMLYICETGDNKQTMRNRLFDFWFRSSPRNNEFYVSSVNIRTEDGIENYATIILRLDNPHLKDVSNEFIDTSRMLNEKPILRQ